MAPFDVQSLSDAVLLENTASRILRVRDDLLALGRDDLAAAAGYLLRLVAADATELRNAIEQANAAAVASDE